MYVYRASLSELEYIHKLTVTDLQTKLDTNKSQLDSYIHFESALDTGIKSGSLCAANGSIVNNDQEVVDLISNTLNQQLDGATNSQVSMQAYKRRVQHSLELSQKILELEQALTAKSNYIEKLEMDLQSCKELLHETKLDYERVTTQPQCYLTKQLRQCESKCNELLHSCSVKDDLIVNLTHDRDALGKLSQEYHEKLVAIAKSNSDLLRIQWVLQKKLRDMEISVDHCDSSSDEEDAELKKRVPNTSPTSVSIQTPKKSERSSQNTGSISSQSSHSTPTSDKTGSVPAPFITDANLRTLTPEKLGLSLDQFHALTTPSKLRSTTGGNIEASVTPRTPKWHVREGSR